VLRRAWQGLSQQVDAQGRVIGVSAGTIPGDKARYAARPLGTYPWGSGAFLLAAVAMAEFEAGTAADR
jgi:rhamnogalacturonyl hydrolase YesR